MNFKTCKKYLAILFNEHFISAQAKKRQFICKRPFNSLVFGTHGISPCYCYHGPTISIQEFNRSTDIFNHETLKDLRKRVLQGDYSLCSNECPIIKIGREAAKENFRRTVVDYENKVSASFVPPKERLTDITMAMEDGCNLSCPSCRSATIPNSVDKSILQKSWNYLYDKLPQIESLSLGGSGEPLINTEVTRFLSTCDEIKAPNLKSVSLITNGINLTKANIKRYSSFISKRLELLISIDGNTKTTYERNRRGASYEELHQNLADLPIKQLKLLRFLYVVQDNNFEEIPSFIDTAKRYGAEVNFYPIRNWGTFTSEEFNNRNVYNCNHPNYARLQEILKLPDFKSERINFKEY